MQACSQGIAVSKDQFEDNCFKRNIRSITPCFDAVSYLCKYLLELLELSRSIWFSFYPYAFYSYILLSVHSYVPIYFTFIKSVAISNDLSQPLKAKGVKLQLHHAIYRLRFYSKSLIHILSLSNSHNNVAPIQKNRGDKSHHVIVA